MKKIFLFSIFILSSILFLGGNIYGAPGGVIRNPAITGVTIPVVGATPVATLDETDQYTATISWSPSDSTFVSNTVYTSTIILTPKVGSTLTGVSANFFTVEGTSVPATNVANSGTITAVFPATATPSGWMEQINAGSRSWKNVASSADGTKLVAGATGDYIYTSSDGGSTWTTQIGSGQHSWVSITSSSNGTKLAATDGTHIYTSSNSGVTWVERITGAGGSLNWKSITSSSDGAKIAIVGIRSYIYTSSDSGATWVEHTGLDNAHHWFSVAYSPDGTKLIVGGGDNFSYNGYIHISSDDGLNWLEKIDSGLHNWSSIASNFDGTMLVASDQAGSIYTSSDSGDNWLEHTVFSGTKNWTSIASSSNGTKLIAVDWPGYVYVSTDSGTTWIPQTILGEHDWVSSASSSDGTKLIVADTNFGAYIYTYGVNIPTLTTSSASNNSTTVTLNGYVNTNSTTRGFQYGLDTNYGLTTIETDSFTFDSFSANISSLSENVVYHYRAYATNSAGTGHSPDATFIIKPLVAQPNSGQHTWTSIASSLYGIKLAATDGTDIYTSTDSGTTWILRNANISGVVYLSKITSSSDGKKLAITNAGNGNDNCGYIYTSTDSGATWVERINSGTHNWWSLASSSNGIKLVAGGGICGGGGSSNGYIYTSTDGGETWTQRTTSQGTGTWVSLASSSDGTKLVALNQGEYIYTSSNSGISWTQRIIPEESTNNWQSVATSSNGTKLIAVDYNNNGDDSGYVYISIDSGINWTQQTNLGSHPWVYVISSADGTRLTITDHDGFVYNSTNSGTTWTQQIGSDNLSLKSLTSSFDGNKLAAIVDGDYIYTYSSGETTDPLALSTTSATSITETTATFNGTITNDAGEEVVVGFKYGKTEDHGTDIAVDGTFATDESFSSEITGLTCGTTYYYEAFAENSAEETAFGGDQTFTTESCPRSRSSGSFPASIALVQPQITTTLPTTPSVCSQGDLFSSLTGEACPTIVTSPLNITRVLQLNMKGDDVKSLQVYLNTHGYILTTIGAGSPNQETTFFGLLTKKAVIAFQKANKLTADGIVGPKTREMMK